MFKKIIESIMKQLNRAPVSVDPSRFDDPVAMTTSWSPAKRGGASFGTHKLVERTPGRMEFRATVGAKLFSMVFLLVGLGILIGFSFNLISKGEIIFSFDTIFPMLFGLIFAGVGVLMLFVFTKRVVFDKTIGRFYKGRKSPAEMVQQFDPASKNKAVELGRIHALQLIAEYCSGQKSSYYSYELNLVLEDGERVNVVDHGNLKKIQEDAKTLSNFLGKPVWDGT